MSRPASAVTTLYYGVKLQLITSLETPVGDQVLTELSNSFITCSVLCICVTAERGHSDDVTAGRNRKTTGQDLVSPTGCLIIKKKLTQDHNYGGLIWGDTLLDSFSIKNKQTSLHAKTWYSL